MTLDIVNGLKPPETAAITNTNQPTNDANTNPTTASNNSNSSPLVPTTTGQVQLAEHVSID